MDQEKPIRNFCIVAHVDHGKSTLADRFLELAGVVRRGDHVDQMLDRNPISRERGITIKLAPVRMEYKSKNSQIKRVLNLIDTPGHVDFSYEVDRTLACVEGAILLVDATKGIQAQTLANAYKAAEKNLVIIPVVNKIDLPSAQAEKTKKQISEFLGTQREIIYEISAKTGQNVEILLDAVIERIPPPHSIIFDKEIAQALIFDSYYDSHRGVIAFVRLFSGILSKGLKVRLAATKETFEIMEVGIFGPDLRSTEQLSNGEIGYVITNLKDIHQVRVGDTVVAEKGLSPPLAGYRKVNPMVFASLFPTDANEYESLKNALEKLYLTDSSLVFTPIYSQALGGGFRVGFLGLLHADVVRERLEREFGLSLVLTPPQIDYKKENNQFYEPYVKVLIITPEEYLGRIMQLCQEFRARFTTMDNKGQLSLHYEMPMSEMISDFFDQLKSVSSGYASLDWEFLRYEKVDADKLSILLNGSPVEEFSEIVNKERAFGRASSLLKKLRELIPRQQYDVKIQAQFKGKIIASERIPAFRKDVTKKLYGGDRTRKDKLLEKQKEGKKKMKMIGRVEIPKEAFLKLFKKT
ncbi:elongation factor 4 [Candidatus Roizmanbacteria bacterium]|nr:elongation factor 4 [Candidatus Roizmanbacteria bacterium]